MPLLRLVNNSEQYYKYKNQVRIDCSGFFRNVSVFSINDLNPTFSHFCRILMRLYDFGLQVLGFTVQWPEFVFHLLPDDLQFDRIIKNKVAKFCPNEKPYKCCQVVSSERLVIKDLDLILNWKVRLDFFGNFGLLFCHFWSLIVILWWENSLFYSIRIVLIFNFVYLL